MDDGRGLRVEVVQPVEQIQGPPHHGIEREAFASLQNFRKILPLDVLHHEEVPLPLGEVVRHVREQRVVQPVQQSCLPLEGLRQILIAIEGFFNGYGGSELLVGGSVNRTHTAHAYLVLDEESILQNCPDFDHFDFLEAIPVPRFTESIIAGLLTLSRRDLYDRAELYTTSVHQHTNWSVTELEE